MLTLLIPIGGPGAGKTTLGNNLCNLDLCNLNTIIFDKVFITCRDDLYAKCKKDNIDWSQRKIRRFLFDKFVEFRESVASWRRENPEDSVIVYLDSSNAQRGGRKYIIDEFLPDKVVFINMRRNYETLIKRVAFERVGHPTFPLERDKQEVIIKKILDGLEFAGEQDVISANDKMSFTIIEI